MAPVLSDYELQRQKNIEENRRILESLIREQKNEFKDMLPKPKEKEAKPKQKKEQPMSGNGGPDPSTSSDVENKAFLPRRKSGRLTGKKLKFSYHIDDDGKDKSDPDFDSNDEEEEEDSEYSGEEENSPAKKRGVKRRRGVAIKRPKAEKIVIPKNRANFYGAVPGIPIGKLWETRMACCADGVHRPTVAGIHSGHEGAYSISLSGGYEDDVDLGDCFTYTGEGGRALKGTDGTKNLRTAPQSKDQTLTRGNLALSLNAATKRPVRVIRGYKLCNKYAPEYGYRYDGLYTVEKFWTCEGKSGFSVYKFALIRCPDQPPPPWSPDFVAPVEQPSDPNPILDDIDDEEEPVQPTVLKVKLFNKKK